MSVRKSAILAAMLAVAGIAGISAETRLQAAEPRTYSNPLLPDVQMADPHVIKVNQQYYLYATTHTRGYDVYVSDDLVNWSNQGSAFSDPRGGCWAPDVFCWKKDGKYYLYYTVDADPRSRGGANKVIGVAKADTPLGPFEDQGELFTKAIDAHMFQDDDKELYLYYVDLTRGFKIMVQEMAAPTAKRGEPKVLIQPTEPWEMASGRVTEGPFMLKRNGIYYLMYSGSGANSPQYAIGYATSKGPNGVFTKYPGNPIAAREGKVLGPGHHSVVEGPDGKLWMVYHQKWTEQKSFRRFLALDPLWFDEDGVIRTVVTRETLEPAPRKKPVYTSPKSAN